MVLIGNLAYSQRTCGTDHHHQELMNDPEYKIWFDSIQKKVYESIDMGSRSRCESPVTIPVAVHFNGGVTNANIQCLIDASLAQVQVMNDDFAAMNADIAIYTEASNACPQAFPLSALFNGTCIEFCLATSNHPSGSGIIEGDFAITIGQKSYPNAGIEWSGYFNIFVEDNLPWLGMAPVSGAANPIGNGIQIRANSFGGPEIECFSGVGINTNSPYNLGRTGTHEAGHYFGLYHIFDGCNNGDNIDDTPDQEKENYYVPTVDTNNCTSTAENTCNSLDFFMNYMDYVEDETMVMFTTDQSSVMDATADHSLWKPDGCLFIPFCYRYDPPDLATSNAGNDCPEQTINLNNLFSGTIPHGTQLIWSLDADPSDGVSPVLDPPVVYQDGEYFAYFYNPLENCYSTGSSVVVTIEGCCHQDNDTYITSDTTFDAPLLMHGNLYVQSGATLTITTSIQFPQDKALFVQSGGKLVLEGSSATLNKCPEATGWRGVVVESGGHLEVDEAYIYNAHTGVEAQTNSTIDINVIVIFGLNNYTGAGIRLNGGVNAIHLKSIKIGNVRNGIFGWHGNNLFHLEHGEIQDIMYGVIMVNNSIIMEDYSVSNSQFAVLLDNSPNSILRNNLLRFSNTGISAGWSPFLYIADNTIGATALQSGVTGISLFESGGSRIENNPAIQARRIGIRLIQSDAAIAFNSFDIFGTNNQSGGGIQINDSHGTQIVSNYLNVDQSAFGIESVTSSGTRITDNEIEHFSTIATRTAAIRSMGSMDEVIAGNIATGVANTTGIIAQNSSSNRYICNEVINTAEGIGVFYNSEMQNIRGNTLDSWTDLALRSMTGNQSHHGNYFIGGRARADELNTFELLNSQFFVNSSVVPSFMPGTRLPVNNWFIEQANLNHFTCSGSASAPWVPFDSGDPAEICSYYDHLKDIRTSRPEQFEVKHDPLTEIQPENRAFYYTGLYPAGQYLSPYLRHP